jgi:hypothetical protein
MMVLESLNVKSIVKKALPGKESSTIMFSSDAQGMQVDDIQRINVNNSDKKRKAW